MIRSRVALLIVFMCLLTFGIEACRASIPTATRPRAHTPTRLPRPSFTPFRTNTPAPAPTLPPPTGVPPSEVPLPTAAFTPHPVSSPHPSAIPPTETATPTLPVIPPQAPHEGGSWDFENGFFARASGFEGRVDYVGNVWDYFRHRGQNGQGTFNENKNQANVHRGVRSQEIAFESSDGDAGIFRTLDVIPKHRYTISAWGRHTHSRSPIELALGIDLTGGVDSDTGTVQWFPWQQSGEDRWVYTEETVGATGPQMTIYLRVTHRVAAPGGATILDDVRVMDLGE